MPATLDEYRIETGTIESSQSIPLSDALAAWRREAQVGILDNGRYRCRFFVWGTGQPLVFVHGMSDQARCFVPVIAHLKEHFRCIAYELPTGGSDGATLTRLRHTDLVDDLLDLIDHLRLGQVCVYGGSFGSTIALAALGARPRTFLRAAMHGAFARRKLAPAERILATMALHWNGPIRRVPLRAAIQRKTDAAAFAVAPETWDYQRANTATTPIRALAHRALIIDRLDLRPILPSIRHPILLVTGDSDSLVSDSAVHELVDALPHADLLEFQNCGHYPQYTHVSGLAEALRRFLLPPCGIDGSKSRHC